MSKPSRVSIRGDDRRKHRTPLRYPERRSGFDRRSRSGWRGRYEASLRELADRPRTLLLVLATIVVFNFMDYWLTLRVLQAGGSELNPIMDRLFSIGPETAALVKLGLAGAVALGLLALRRYRRTLEVAIAVLLGYSALMFYHVLVAIRIGA
ncbi:MAG: DUF5658 family protein [Acidimicrobiia bacterium]|nr:DUF5658 family protein [Acidimicrobiia bacterium]